MQDTFQAHPHHPSISPRPIHKNCPRRHHLPNQFSFSLSFCLRRGPLLLFGGLDGLLADHEPHGREAARGAPTRAADAPRLEHHLGVLGAGGNQANQLEERQDFGHQEVHDRVELKARPLEGVPRRRQGRVPSKHAMDAVG